MILKETYKLSNGFEIPKIGLGTWQVPNKIAARSVLSAIKAGYRHIDTAAAYENESGVGMGIRQSEVTREEIFITTKVPAEIKTYRDAKRVIAQSLQLLDTAYIDLLLLHAPKPWPEMFSETAHRYFKENLEVWKAMEEAKKDGTIRSLGVSNFIPQDMENILEHGEISPIVNQVKFHIGHTPEETLQFCNARHILVEAYSPMATGRLLNNEEIMAVADKYGVSIPQLCIRYALQRGTLPLPKSTHEDYIVQNTQLDFLINEHDMDHLTGIKLETKGYLSTN